MAEVGDFVVIDRNQIEVAPGKWKSVTFATGGRNSGGTAYALLMLGVAKNAVGDGVAIRVIINDHPIQMFVNVKEDSTTTAISTFPASFLHDGGTNVLGLHSQQERAFFVYHAVVHFRQNS
jgi:hypothetical protein